MGTPGQLCKLSAWDKTTHGVKCVVGASVQNTHFNLPLVLLFYCLVPLSDIVPLKKKKESPTGLREDAMDNERFLLRMCLEVR